MKLNIGRIADHPVTAQVEHPSWAASAWRDLTRVGTGAGAVAEYPSVLHPLAPLDQLPGGILAWRVENGERSALRAEWTVTVTNTGPVPVLGVEIGCDKE